MQVDKVVNIVFVLELRAFVAQITSRLYGVS